MGLINSLLVKMIPVFPKSFISLFSSRYIAGESLEDAIKESQNLNRQNMSITLDVLGENISDLTEATEAKNNCLAVLDAIDRNGIDGNLSIKLTQLGLKLDKSACEENVIEILEKAKNYNNFVRIDMEDSSCTNDTLDICLKMHKRYDRVGTVIQAYLKRSEADIRMLTKEGVNIRLCKGIYNESPAIAFKDRKEIQENYTRLMNIILDAGTYLGIATHDPFLVENAYRLIKEKNLSPDRYEFQMLLGISENLRGKIVADKHKMRVYVPFGEEWYPYSIRRFKENPQLAGYIIKNLFTKN